MKKIWIAALATAWMCNVEAQTKIDRSQRPVAGPAPVISVKDPTTFKMSNGMTVLIVENHKVPKVRAYLSIDRGPILEGSKAGVMDLMGQMLGEGTTTMNKEKFDESVDLIGADVNLSSGGGSVSAMTRYFNQAFMLMADGIRNPAFPQESFDKLKTQTLTSLKSEDKNIGAISSRVQNALSYGKNTAMGEFVTEASVKAINLEDVKAAYTQYVTPSRSYLTFVGDISVADAKMYAEKAFGTWKGTTLSLPKIADVKNPSQTEIDFVDFPTAVQSEIKVSNLVKNPMNGPDYYAILLANQILGGGSESKLFMNLREKHGFTYGSYSNIGRGKYQSLFSAEAQVRSEKTDSAITEIIREIRNMRDGNITEEELRNAKALYNGSFALRMEDPSIPATYASNILINDLPKDFYRTYLQKINEVTLADVQRVSKNYMLDNNFRITVVGNGNKLLPGISKLGYPIKKYDKYAEPIIDKPMDSKVNETVKTTDKISAYQIIEDYLKAIGGKEDAKKVNSLFGNFNLEMMGQSFTGTEKRMAPNMTAIELKMGTMTIMKQAFDGKAGYQQQGPQKAAMSEAEIKEAQDDRAVIPQVNYLSPDYKTEYMGSGKIGDESTYRLKVIMPSGRTAVQEYSTKTGLLLKEETTSKQGDQEVPSIVEYKNYKKVGNIMLPFEVTRNAGGQEFTMQYVDYKINEGVTAEDFK